MSAPATHPNPRKAEIVMPVSSSLPAEAPRYLLSGEVVTLLVRPNQKRTNRPAQRFPMPRIKPFAPPNVLIQHADGSRTVRPFRGLRRANV